MLHQTTAQPADGFRAELEVSPVAIIGAGVMGSGLAEVFAEAGCSVCLIDNSAEALDRSRAQIGDAVRLGSLFGRQISSPTEVLENIEFTTSTRGVAGVRTLIENITEDWEAKRDLHESLRDLYRDGTLVAINTSVISITRLAAHTRDPKRTVGMHFMNPVPLSSAVEVIRGAHTSPETIERATALARLLGKESIVVNDMPGFVSNRVLMLMVNEAIWTVQDRVAEPPDVDRLFKLCFGHKMGPLETADLIGLDTILHSIAELYDSYKDGKFRPCPLLQTMVYSGRLGRKSGRGFYDYTPTSVGQTRGNR